METIETLAEFVSSCDFKDIPAASVAMAEDCVLDPAGCAAAGFSTGGAKSVRAVAGKRLGGGAFATPALPAAQDAKTLEIKEKPSC